MTVSHLLPLKKTDQDGSGGPGRARRGPEETLDRPGEAREGHPRCQILVEVDVLGAKILPERCFGHPRCQILIEVDVPGTKKCIRTVFWAPGVPDSY